VLYDQKIAFTETDDVLVIVCGGASITFDQLSKYAVELSV
jgi:L-serine/L-threonine ammonia-lyase